ncbi:MAG TPA: hypothetical protein VM182_09050 [Terriglobia bacterium]|nr:hypothetical protein [Terriglobia bacterium]
MRDADSVESLVTLACQVSGGVKAEVDVLDHPGKEILDHAVPFVWER